MAVKYLTWSCRVSQVKATKKSVEASCRTMEAVTVRADKALAALDGKARQLDDANLAKKVAENVGNLRETELRLAALREEKDGLEQRAAVRRERIEDIGAREGSV